MKVIQRPNVSEWLEYVGDFVNVKLHKPKEFEPIGKALETQINSSWYQNFTDTFNTLFSNTYLVKLPTSLEIENANNSDHVCIETIIEHPEIMSAFKFWFNRFGVVSIKLFCGEVRRTLLPIQFQQIFLKYTDSLMKSFPSLQFQYSLLLIGTFLNLTGVSVLKRRNPVSLFFYLLIGMYLR